MPRLALKALALATRFRDDLLGGVQVVRARAVGLAAGKKGEPVRETRREFQAIPYYAWAHRGRGEMAVWLAREPSAAKPLAAPTIVSASRASASFSVSHSHLSALCDGARPKNSRDKSATIFHWWPHKGTTEWVQYEFANPERVSAVEVYWLDDTGGGDCRPPKSWRLLYKDGGRWKPVAKPSGYGRDINKYVKVTFDPVRAEGLRIEVQLEPKFSAGVIEWRVE